MAVRRPDTGEPLRRAGGSGEAVAAIDATFSAPKSVSAVWALAAPELRAEIERAHERAIDRAIGYAVGQVAMVRERVDGAVVHAEAGGCDRDELAAHHRPGGGRIVRRIRSFTPTCCCTPRSAGTGRWWRSTRARGWCIAASSAPRTAPSSPTSSPSSGSRSGAAPGRGGRYFEIDGHPPGADRPVVKPPPPGPGGDRRTACREARRNLRRCSKPAVHRRRAPGRSSQQLRDAGRLVAAEDRRIAWSTRSPKRDATVADLDREWTDAARRVGFGRQQLQRIRVRPALIKPQPAGRAVLLARLTEFDATFDDREARAVALEASAGVPIAQALDGAHGSCARARMCSISPTGVPPPPGIARAERATVQLARRIAATPAAPLPEADVQEHADALQSELRRAGRSLSEEQRRALVLACSDRRLVVIEGQAGTGKSTTLTAIARAHQHQRRQIIVTSTGALAAERLARELQTAGVTAAGLLHRRARRRDPRPPGRARTPVDDHP